MSSLPHTVDPAAVPRLLRLVQNTTTPGRVTVDHLRSNGFGVAEAPHHIGLLRALGFIDKQGRPTTRWTIYSDRSVASAELTKALHDSFAPVFSAFDDVARQPDEAISEVVSAATAYGPVHVRQTVETFRALCASTLPGPELAPAGLPRERRVVLREQAALAALGNSEFESAQRCVDSGLSRPAHVAAWSGYVAFALMRLSNDDFIAVRRVRPAWKGATAEDLAARTPGRQVIDLLAALDLIAPAEEFELAELLQRRNDCAHPVRFEPSLDDASAYVDELLTRSEWLMTSSSLSVP
jgi:hypothetical protein